MVYHKEIEIRESRVFLTMVSADHFQAYIIPCIMAIRTWSNDEIVVLVKGKLRQRTKNALAMCGYKGIKIVEDYAVDYPDNPSTVSCLRFIKGYEHVRNNLFTMIIDCDLMLFEDLWQWHFERLTSKSPFAGRHGARKKPVRKDICDSWEGPFERVCGGIICVRFDWWERTLAARRRHNELVKLGLEGRYREEDEVVLAKIIKESGLDIPESKEFPSILRGIHFGDFKFNKRVNDKSKMVRILNPRSIIKFMRLSSTEKWKSIIEELNDDQLNIILKKVHSFIGENNAV